MDRPVQIDPILVAIKKLDSDSLINLCKTKSVPKVALSVAISTGSIDIVRLLLTSDCSTSILATSYFTAGKIGDDIYYSPMQQAMMLGDVDIINLLLDNGFIITEANLDYLINSNDLELFTELVKLIIANSVNYKFNFNQNLLGPILYLHAYNYNRPAFIQALKRLGLISANYQIDPMGFCPTEDGSIVDPITSDIVPVDRVIPLRENSSNFCFDILTLYNQWRAAGKLQNPITRAPLPAAVVNKIIAYSEANRVKFSFISKDGTETLTIDNDSDLGQLLLLFNEADSKRKINKKYQTPENLNKFDLIFITPTNALTNNRSIYDFDLTTLLKDLNLINSQGPVPELKVLDVDGILFDSIVYSRLYHYAKAKRIEWLLAFIPDIYQVDQAPILDQVSDQDFEDLLQVVGEHENDITAYTLAKDLLRDIRDLAPKISAEQARSLIKLISENHYENSVNYLSFIKHLIYSRVVDKFNLNAQGIEGQYLRNRYQLPDWRFLGQSEEEDY